MPQSQISEFETGKKTPTLVDAEHILSVLNAPVELIDELSTLTRIANTEWQDKRSTWRTGLEKRQAERAALESDARTLRYFLPAMITGLLATPAYVRASLSHSPGDTSGTVARKLERQAVLYDTSKSFTFLLTEQAARWAIVPRLAMASQFDRLISLSHLPNIRIGVIPIGTVIDFGPMNTFTVYDDRLATAESFAGRMVFRDPRDIAEHLARFELYERHALFRESAREQLVEWSGM